MHLNIILLHIMTKDNIVEQHWRHYNFLMKQLTVQKNNPFNLLLYLLQERGLSGLSGFSFRPWFWGCTSSVSHKITWCVSIFFKALSKKDIVQNVQSTMCFISALTLQTSLRAQGRVSVLRKHFDCRAISNLHKYKETEID